MKKIKEVIIVEGKYDKIKLDSIVDALVITCDGFGIYKQKNKMSLLKELAEKKDASLSVHKKEEASLTYCHNGHSLPIAYHHAYPYNKRLSAEADNGTWTVHHCSSDSL